MTEEIVKWQNIHILGFMIFSCSLVWIVAGELVTKIYPVGNIHICISLAQCSIGGVICLVGAVKGGCPF